MSCYSFDTHEPILIILAEILHRKDAIKQRFTFPLHVSRASVLPGETGNQKIAFLPLNVARCFANKHTKRIQNITWLQLNPLYRQNDRLYAPDMN